MSSKTLYIANSVANRLKEFRKQFNEDNNLQKVGLLTGYESLTIKNDNDATLYCSVTSEEANVAFGTEILGIYYFSELTDEEIIKLAEDSLKKESGNFLILYVDNDLQMNSRLIDIKSKQLTNCEVNYIDDNLSKDDLLVIGVNGVINLNLKLTNVKDNLFENINHSFNEFRNELNLIKFKLNESKLCLEQKTEYAEQCIDLYSFIEDSEITDIDDLNAPKALKNKMKDKIRKQKLLAKLPLIFTFEPNLFGGDNLQNLLTNHDNFIKIDSTSGEQSKTIPINFDAFFYISKKSSFDNLVEKIFDSISKQINLVKYCLIENIDDQVENEIKLLPPGIYNFKPKLNQFFEFISVAYPIALNDEQLIKKREDLHKIYLLTKDQPMLRKTMSFMKSTCSLLDANTGGVNGGAKLLNVHLGLNAPANGQVALVKGVYTYFHYMQDKFNDNGWGCAYRSLQTIISWFQHQGYIDKRVPKHKEIQQALVDTGDKPASFVDSNKWIGSQEVSYVLNQLYGITSKIIFVSSGGELATKGRELLTHFQNQGTPIMIGGGVLAHTIIGIYFNETNGAVKYLVLDPHYTGSEDLSTIHKKGWCGWKQEKFWDNSSFYNLCLPQKPNTL